MNVLKLISSIFKPAADLIDSVHTSEDEKLAAKTQLMLIQSQAVQDALEYETAQLNARKEIILAETKSESWLTRNWRPMTMLAFVVSVMGYWFGLTPDTLPEAAVLSMFNLVKIGLGGYVVGRSAEKVAPSIVDALKKKDDT